jgi:hypothetical protein
MYAMVVQGGTTPDKRDEMNRLVTELLIPALWAESGYPRRREPRGSSYGTRNDVDLLGHRRSSAPPA